MTEKKVLYIEGTSGISGDMFVGALIDLGADLDVLAKVFDSIPADGFGVDVGRVKKNGIDCVDFDVILDEENHDHDMAYLYGPEPAMAAEAAHTAGDVCAWQEQGAADGAHGHGEMEDLTRSEGDMAVHTHEEGCCGHHHHEDGACCGHHHGEEEGCCGHHHHEDGACCGHHHGEEGGCCGHHHHEDGACCGHHHGEEGGCCGHHHHEDGACCGHHHGEEEGCCGHHHHEDGACCGHHHGEEGGCCGHHHHHAHAHVHRHLADVEALIDGTDMTDRARAIAKRIFRIVAEAEAKAHRLPIEEVHFHEVGALDSIVDIIAAAVCFDNLGITDVIVPALSEGRGTVRCQHGVLPVPVPAVANIAEAHGLTLSIMDVQGEFVTPTGAAIAAALRTSDALPARFHIEKIGCGAGKRAYTARPGFLRAMLITPEESGDRDEALLLKSDIDDCTGETLGYVMGRLLDAGARDVHYTPVFMKKNRPAWELAVICGRADAAKLEDIIFRETTTIGIREIPVERAVLPREEITVATPYGEAQVKCCAVGGIVKYYPEYESVKAIAEAGRIPFADAYQMVKDAAENR